MKVQMLVATHKPYEMPTNRSEYLPIFVGAALHKTIPLGYQSDAEGENISKENPHYNELTAIYWAWKNSDADIVGLDHYRRYFVKKKTFKTRSFENILSKRDILQLLENSNVVVPPRRRYFIESIESHYLHSHNRQELDALKTVFSEMPEAFQNALKSVLGQKSAHMFNMFIMKRRDFDDYCQWLFPLLKRVENSLDYSQLCGNETRALGFLAEIMLDVWIIANNKKYIECRVQFMEKTHWPRKITIFLLNKLTNGRYTLNTHVNS